MWEIFVSTIMLVAVTVSLLRDFRQEPSRTIINFAVGMSFWPLLWLTIVYGIQVLVIIGATAAIGTIAVYVIRPSARLKVKQGVVAGLTLSAAPRTYFHSYGPCRRMAGFPLEPCCFWLLEPQPPSRASVFHAKSYLFRKVHWRVA